MSHFTEGVFCDEQVVWNVTLSITTENTYNKDKIKYTIQSFNGF